jgi:hypothetical protein
MIERPESYLGDGLYASYDGYQVKLRAPRDGGDHVIYLDPIVMTELVVYITTLQGCTE